MENYTMPEFEVVEFELVDVLTVSRNDTAPGGWY